MKRYFFEKSLNRFELLTVAASTVVMINSSLMIGGLMLIAGAVISALPSNQVK
jgi:hypothetical protein